MKKLQLIYGPKASDEALLASAIMKTKASRGKDHLEYHHYLPGLLGGVQIASLPKKHAKADTSLQVTLCPSDLILGAGSFSSKLGALGVKVLLPGIQHAVQAFFGLERSDIPLIALEDFTVERTTMEFFFEAESEDEATDLLLSLARHSKVVIDFSSVIPNKKWLRPKRKSPRVNWSRDASQVLEISLPFGLAKICIAGDSRRLPSAFPTSDHEVDDDEKSSFRNRLFCIEIDAEMALVTDGMDPSFSLPLQLEKWLPHGMSRSPYEFVWDAFIWETWLNLDLPGKSSMFDSDEANLSDEQKRLLLAYFHHEVLRYHPVINDDLERFMAFRRALIVKAHVDLLNPWRFFRWNSAAMLRPILTFSGQLTVEKMPLMAEFALTWEKAKGTAEVLVAALQKDRGRGNWT